MYQCRQTGTGGLKKVVGKLKVGWGIGVWVRDRIAQETDQRGLTKQGVS